MNEPKYQKLAKLYEKKHVPIKTPANFRGTSWADVVKRNPNKKDQHQPTPRPKEKTHNPIELRLDKMEQAINQILRHLKLEEIEVEETKEQNSEETKSKIPRSTPESKIRNSDKGKGPEEIKQLPTSPLAIIDAITKGKEDPESKIKNLSQAFAKYHQETGLRIKHLEHNMADILARLSGYSDTEMDPNPNIHQ